MNSSVPFPETPASSMELAQGPVLRALWLQQPLKPKTPEIRVPRVRVLRGGTFVPLAHLGPLVPVRAIHFNKPCQLTALKQG